MTDKYDEIQRLDGLRDKTCTRCKVAKSPDDFSIMRANKDGRKNWCSQCDSEYKKERNPLFSVLTDMIRRCYDEARQDYPRYGGRGITVCDEWFKDKESFIKWGEANGYEKGLHIDRKDNDGNYEPSNCRFITLKENNRNKRTSKWWWVNGIKFNSSKEAASVLGVSHQTIVHWCEGYTSGKYKYPPRDGCNSELKYGGDNGCK